jgi:hypothetical protein
MSTTEKEHFYYGAVTISVIAFIIFFIWLFIAIYVPKQDCEEYYVWQYEEGRVPVRCVEEIKERN